MKILHTSDWHLGRTFGPVSLHDVQGRFCDWVVEQARTRGVDLVIVAGDLYDRPIPPTESVRLWRRTLLALAESNIPVVAIAGNHDGPDRVGASDGLTDAMGIHVRGSYDRVGEPIPLSDDHGPVDVVVLPYLDPVLAPPEWRAALSDAGWARDHEGVLRLALERAAAGRTPGSRSVVVAHAFVAGTSQPKVADSEKRLSIGTAELVPVSVFDGHDYVALGHLHRPQSVGSDAVRYSGTPLPYSFAETDPKEVLLVDLGAEGVTNVESVPVPMGRPVAKLRGTIEELLGAEEYEAYTEHFVLAELTETEYVTDARDRLTVRFPHVVEIQLVGVERAVADIVDDEGRAIARSALEPIDAAVAFWTEMSGGTEPTDDERSVLAHAFDALRAGSTEA